MVALRKFFFFFFFFGMGKYSITRPNHSTCGYTHRPIAAALVHQVWRREREGGLRSRCRGGARRGSLVVCSLAGLVVVSGCSSW